MVAVKTWTDEREQAARKLFDAGASASEISAELSNQFNTAISRNAVIGMWCRRGWTGSRVKKPAKARQSAAPKRANDLAKRERAAIIVPPTAATEKVRIQRLVSAAHGSMRVIESSQQTVALLREVHVEPLNLDLIELQHGQCRYPFGDGPFRFCGHPVEPGRPYCTPHHALCTTVYARSTPDEMRSAAMTRRWAHKKAMQLEAAE